MPSLYEELRAAGCTLDHHCSDLYIVVDDTSQPIMRRYRQRMLRRLGQPTNGRLAHVTGFVDHAGVAMWDVFGAYDPYWRR